jgi:hypothetical protein
MAFITDLHQWDIQPIAGTDRWINQTELRYFSQILGREVVVPTGYPTDLASIPRFAHSFMHPASKHIRAAAVIHDYIYTHLCKELTKAQADAVLREAMGHVVCPAPMWKRNIVYLAVRVGGKGGW